MICTCKMCDREYSTFTNVRVDLYKRQFRQDFCSEFCENTALHAQKTFEIALPCFSEFKQPVSKTIEQFGFKDTRDDFKNILQALAR